MNVDSIIFLCDPNVSVESLVKELAAQIRAKSNELTRTRTELSQARIKANNSFRQALKAAQALEINCDHAQMENCQLSLLESDFEAALAAERYLQLRRKVSDLTNQMKVLSIKNEAALAIYLEQMKEQPQ